LWSKDKTGKLIEVNFNNKERTRRQEKDLQLIENGSFYIFDKDKFKIHKTRLFDSIGEYRMESWQVFEIDNFDDLELCRHISKIKNIDGIYG
jgi:CMP-N-acetylneuraminic acid synthetase